MPRLSIAKLATNEGTGEKGGGKRGGREIEDGTRRTERERKWIR